MNLSDLNNSPAEYASRFEVFDTDCQLGPFYADETDIYYSDDFEHIGRETFGSLSIVGVRMGGFVLTRDMLVQAETEAQVSAWETHIAERVLEMREAA